MSYHSPLESRLAKRVTKAIVDYALIEDGDRVMIGLSGGKDSWALMQILGILRIRAPITFSLVAVNVDSGYEDYRHDVIASTCEARGWECRIVHEELDAQGAGECRAAASARSAAQSAPRSRCRDAATAGGVTDAREARRCQLVLAGGRSWGPPLGGPECWSDSTLT